MERNKEHREDDYSRMHNVIRYHNYARRNADNISVIIDRLKEEIKKDNIEKLLETIEQIRKENQSLQGHLSMGIHDASELLNNWDYDLAEEKSDRKGEV
jgi:uncharacterized FlaG/YvyC family protein